MRLMSVSVVIFAVLWTQNLRAGQAPCLSAAKTIDQKLACIPGLSVLEITNSKSPKGTRQFDLKFIQSVDHMSPKTETFQQRLVLTHRSESEPMLLETSGYEIFGIAESTVTQIYRINQLQVEHRYFANSVPAVVDWSKLNVKQSAYDFHKIVLAFKEIYKGPWVNTGASKGGMTSVFHRAAFPDDLVGTIADVAPLSFSTEDIRYANFVNGAGGDPYKGCREQLKQLQVDLLKNRKYHVAKIQGDFSFLGSADLAFEHAVSGLPFVFWQYTDPTDTEAGCSAIPSNGTDDEKMAFLEIHMPMDDFTNGGILPFQPYYYQAATQLGNPADDRTHLINLLMYPYTIDQYAPAQVSYTYSNSMMLSIESWAKQTANAIMFVYGEFDPWSAGAFPKSETGKEVYHYVVPGGNHSSEFIQLPDAERKAALATVSKWLGKAPVVMPTQLRSSGVESLESLELRARRHIRL